MIIVTLQGGLGNQMFQYAAAKSLSVKYNSPLLLDDSILKQTASVKKEGFTPRAYELGIFKNISERMASAKTIESFRHAAKPNKLFALAGLPYKKKYTESAFTFDAAFFLQQPPVLLSGYFQSEKYFSSIASAIRQKFSFTNLSAGDENNAVLQQINNGGAISVHVRRGDYVNDMATSAAHGACGVEYYTKAFAYMQQQFPESVFVFFSDDPVWVKNTFTTVLPGSLFIQNNHTSQSWKDMYLMSKCRHHIIANSSFSWWGAWLNNDADKRVIAPKTWFADTKRNEATCDLVPENWTRL